MVNVLSAIQQPAYHFALYASPMTITDKYPEPNDANGVLLAETGRTETNIVSVDITTYSGVTNQNLNNSMVLFEMKIVEPMSASFFDSLAGVGVFTHNWMKTPFMLHLKFHGYDPATGAYIEDPVGRTWKWKVKVTNIDVEIHAGGATYHLELISFDDVAVMDHFSVLGDGFTSRGKTVGDHFNSLKQHLMTSQIMEYGMVRHNIDFQVHAPSPSMGFVPVSSEPMSWAIIEPNDEVQLARAQSIAAIPGETHIGTNPIDTISSIATGILANTIEGQQLITRSMDPNRPANAAPNAAVWKVVATTSVRTDLPYDVLDDDYNYNITYHIVPHITFGGILAVEQRMDAENQESVKAKMAWMAENNRLAKEYDYLFTGRNTEVINVDIKFSAMHKAYTPRGENMSNSTSIPAMMGNEQYDTQRGGADQAELLRIRNMLISLAQQGFSADSDEMRKALSKFSSLNNRLLVEDLKQLFPQTFDRETKRTRSEHIGDAETNIRQGKSNYRLFIAQYMSERPVLMDLEMTIKGDPYWLGPSGEERMQPVPGVVEPFLGDNAILLNIIVPAGVGGDGTPLLNKSNTFSGLYTVHQIKSSFSQGKFVQTLSCIRNMNTILKG